ncbi:S8 family serine peptidase [Ralstonia solanacearum]|uniref:S8 family serine peptidase n=1 Tax=Ralstonia solanacearum TaxID=305 RepID=UPI0007C97BFE|nr:S8 family serine peptidase [Ralstonia solanacearum]OAI58458.1 hypothetical protein RSP597_25365 [Ralstonia solanacearum]
MSVVTRKGDAEDIEPANGYAFASHGNDVARVVVEPGNRFAPIDHLLTIAIAKLNAQTAPFDISVESVPAALSYARTIGATVVNLSVVTGATSEPLETSVQSSWGLIVSAAGNDAQNVDQANVFPPALGVGRERLLVVGAHDWNGKITDFSNWGNSVDILAPGCAIPIPDKNGRVQLVSGTSFSAPFVTYTALLLRSVMMPQRPALLRNRIIASGRFHPEIAGLTKFGVTLDIERAIRIKEDSYLPTGSQTPVYGVMDPMQNITCLNDGAPRSFLPDHVSKVVVGYPRSAGKVAPAVWSEPASDGPLSQTICEQGIEQSTFRFKENSQTNFTSIPWSAAQDVVMRVHAN